MRDHAPWIGLGVAIVLFAAAMVVEDRVSRADVPRAAPRLSSPVVYVARDGYRHAALLVGTADGEHWNLVVWTPSGDSYTRHGVARGEPGVPNTWHVAGEQPR